VAGLFLCWEAYDSADGDFAPHGPWLAPLVVTGGWVVLAAWYLVSQFVRPDRPTGATATAVDADAGTGTGTETDPDAETETETETETDPDPASEDADRTASVQWLTPALLCVALLGYVLALEPAGFVLASAVFFVATARILGSHHSIRDVLVAVPLTVAIYFGFTQLLEITLPAGVMPL
jgi:putative tricarboxylic transport membrane protein